MRFYHLYGTLVSPLRVGMFFAYNTFFHTPRARVLVWNEDGELLLVRNWGGRRQWGLPGGGMKGNERPVTTAKRELYEETGVDVSLDELVYVATLRDRYEAPIFAVTITRVNLPTVPHNPREITDLRWFSPQDLPAALSVLVPLALRAYQKQNDIDIIN